MTVAAIAAAGIGAAGTITASALSSRGGGGGSMSGATGQTNPAATWAGLNLFGYNWNPKKGWVQSPIGNSIFGPKQVQYLKDLMKPVPIDPTAVSAARQGIEQGMAGVKPAQDALTKSMDWISGAVDTGPTSIDPLIAKANFDMWNNQIPQLAEQFSGPIGTFGTDFLGAATRNLTGMELDLRSKEFDATEAWKDRLLKSAPAYGSLATSRASLPIAMGSDIYNLGSTLRTGEKATKPGTDVLNLLQSLSNISSQGQLYQPGYNPSSGTAGLLQGLGQLSSGLAAAFPQKTPPITVNTGGGNSNPAQPTYIYPSAGAQDYQW